MTFRTREPNHMGTLVRLLKTYVCGLKPGSRLTADGKNFIVSARDGGSPTVINSGNVGNCVVYRGAL